MVGSARDDDERDLVAQWAREGKSNDQIQKALDEWRRRGGRLTVDAVRSIYFRPAENDVISPILEKLINALPRSASVDPI